MESLLTGKIINLGIQIKGLIMNISQDIRLPFFIIVFFIYTSLYFMFNSEPLSSWKPALQVYSHTREVALLFSLTTYRLLCQWQMLLVTRQLDGKEWITIQDKCIPSARRDYDTADYGCVCSGLRCCDKAGHFSMAGLAKCQHRKDQTPKHWSLKWGNLLQISWIAWQLT